MLGFDLLRILILLGLVAAILVGMAILNLRYRVSTLNTKGIAGFNEHLPSIVLFTAPNCPPCDKVQKPILTRLMSNFRETMQYFEIDTQINPELAKEWGVLSVPSTFILDRRGVPRFVHHGVVTERILLAQIKEIS